MFVWLIDGQRHAELPDAVAALSEPNGLLAIGGDLRPGTLLAAYRKGIFPWFNQGEAILWWSPDPRLVLRPGEVRVSRSLSRRMRRQAFHATADVDFPAVIRACAEPRAYSEETWITGTMRTAYSRLHELGFAHSVEIWRERELVGGLYGVALGKIFFGESMFARATDASKVALVTLCRQLRRWGFQLIDCQVRSDHLISLGAMDLARGEFIKLLNIYADDGAGFGPVPGKWVLDDDL